MLAAFEEAQAAAAPIYDMADIATDPHYAARGSIVEVDGVPMQGLVARLSRDPRRACAGPAARWAPTPPSGSRPPDAAPYRHWTIRPVLTPSEPDEPVTS